jgi:hypothetical protein
MARDILALIAFVDSRQRTPHAIGREANDCVGFCLAAVEAQTGVKVAPTIRWSTAKGIAALLKRYGSLEAAFDAHFKRIPPAFANRGDIAGVPDEQFGIHPMIVEGATLVGPAENGSRRMKRSAMTAAWSIDE